VTPWPPLPRFRSGPCGAWVRSGGKSWRGKKRNYL